MMKRIVVALLISILLYTRFVNLEWGLPYPMHPDERNMAVAIEQLNCNFKPYNTDFRLNECFNPHFFAYGQLPLYLSYGGIQLVHLVTGVAAPPTFIEATMSLRTLSAVSSLGLVIVLLRIFKYLLPKKRQLDSFYLIVALLFLTFQPYAIQFAHFGTTESLLMFFYAIIIYYSLRLLDDRALSFPTTALLSLAAGAALGTKISSGLFFGIPLFVYIYILFSRNKKIHTVLYAVLFMLMAGIVFILTSPHILLNLRDFIGSMNYESAVATGAYKAFYTRQFENTTPLLFQFQNILPYVLGLPGLLFSACGFLFLSWKDKRYNVLRGAVLLVLVPNAFFYAKWTRFIAPMFPLLSLFALLFITHLLTLKKKMWTKLVFYCLFLVSCIPGLAYLSIYSYPDVRFTASEWIYKNIPPQSKILTETANVIDIPVPPPTYTSTPPQYLMNSFNFYDLDASRELQGVLSGSVKQADYIFVPSRRIFMNHPSSSYPLLSRYYERLFNETAGFQKVAEFSSYPRIQLFGKTIWESRDESAEETWTVFDHPVIRIYKRMTQGKASVDFSDYKSVEYTLEGSNYDLYVADTEQKWERGLMYVRSKNDANSKDGMIFIFPDNKIHSFWNNNTYVRLKLYWIKDGAVVGTSNLPSLTETKTITTVSSPVPVDTVIEVIDEGQPSS